MIWCLVDAERLFELMLLLIRNFRNKFKWNLKWYSDIFIQENAFENVVWEMAAILSYFYRSYTWCIDIMFT